MKNSILLVSGILLTLIFVALSASIFEVLYYDNEFSNEMYNQNIYLIVSIVTVAVAWAFAGVYYYAINSVRFSRWYHWLIVLACAIVIAPVISYVYANNIFSDDGLDFGNQLFGFCMVDLVVEAVMFIIASFSMRWWSSNCRHTPIPE